MSLIPYYLRHLRSLGAQSPAARMLTEEMLSPFARDPFFRDPFKYMRQAISQLEREQLGDGALHALEESDVRVDGKKLEVRLDVSKFKPEEIKVKTVGDEVVVQGRREVRREGGGWTRSHFERRFALPEGFPAEKVECHLDAGRLRLVAFRDAPLPERDVPVQAGRSDAEQEAAAGDTKQDEKSNK